MTLGGSITFWAQAQDANYSAEHFGVAVSTTGNTDASDFTTIAEWTMTAKAGNWYQYTVDLSAYSGQGYVAIRHFDCTDQFILNVDDIIIEGVAPTIEWTTVTVTEPTLTITGLTHDTEYEWQIQGINESCGELEWSEIQTFTAGPLPTQTIALAAGSNYFSTYLDVTLDDLKAALVATGNTEIIIKSRTQTHTYNPSNGRWTGRLTWDVTNMYIITVGEACEITIQGMPVDPAEHSITIKNGSNYIAFPLDESMSVTNAFAGFAVNGDVIKSRNATSTYVRNRWSGGVQNLTPGQGYIYVSGQSEDRPLVFPTSASKAAPTTVQMPKATRDANSVKNVRGLDLIVPTR